MVIFHSFLYVHQWVSLVVPCVSAEPQHADSRAGQSSMTSGYDTTCPSSCPRRMASAFNQLPARNLDRIAGAQWHFSSGAMTGFIGTWGHGDMGWMELYTIWHTMAICPFPTEASLLPGCVHNSCHLQLFVAVRSKSLQER